MKKITILSGKGGVGKSSITASLAVALSKKHKIIAADCDVDASNLAIVLGVDKFDGSNPLTTSQKASFDLDKCNSCKRCYENCYFDAIAWKDNKPKLKQFGCEGCGYCVLLCPEKAIELVDVDNAEIKYGKTKYGFDIVSAQLKMGESGSGKVVTEVRKLAEDNAKDSEFMLIDSAAGIGCPVIASVAGADYVLAITEPTPSGFEDMKRALKMVENFKIPYSIIINKFDINPKKTAEIISFAKDNCIDIIAKLPFDKRFAEALVNLTPIIEYDKGFENIFMEIADNITKNLPLPQQ